MMRGLSDVNDETNSTQTKIMSLIKLTNDKKIVEEVEFLWEDKVFTGCLAALKNEGMPLPEKDEEVQMLIRLILAANETSKVKRMLDYKY